MHIKPCSVRHGKLHLSACELNNHDPAKILLGDVDSDAGQ